MPKLIQETRVQLERSDLDNRVLIDTRKRCRSPGVHFSGILKHVCKYGAHKRYAGELAENELPLQMGMGIAWEEFCVSLCPEIQHQPGELAVCSPDGILIYTTPDGFNERDNQLEEFKYTSKYPRRGAEFLQEWPWMQQGCFELFAWNLGYQSAPEVTRCRWHINYKRGSGGPPFDEYWRYVVEFSTDEMEETYRMAALNAASAVPEPE
jgi:hypothetical protein